MCWPLSAADVESGAAVRFSVETLTASYHCIVRDLVSGLRESARHCHQFDVF